MTLFISIICIFSTFFTVTGFSGASSASVASTPYAGSAFRQFHQTSVRFASTFKTDYDGAAAERAQQGIVPKALDAEQAKKLVEMLQYPPKDEEAFLVDLLSNRISPYNRQVARIKATFLTAIAAREKMSPLVSPEKATELLATMEGGRVVSVLVQLLDNPTLANKAADGLCSTILMFEAFHDVEHKAKEGNKAAKRVMQSWADAEWFTKRAAVPDKITVTVFKVPGVSTTDDLSPAPDAWSRPDIPLHALAMLKNGRDGIKPDAEGAVGPIATYNELKKKGFPLAYVGDVVGAGSSRKSATNSILWFFGDDIPNVPNKRGGGVCIGNMIAPNFFNTMEDSGALPLEMSVDKMHTGDVIDIFPYKGVTKNHATGEVVADFKLKTDVLLDEVRAGGRIPLIIGKRLTSKARASLGLAPSTVFVSVAGGAPTEFGARVLPDQQGVSPNGLVSGQAERDVAKRVLIRTIDMVFDESRDKYDEVLTESAHTLCDREDFRDLRCGGQLKRVSDNKTIVLFGEVVDGDVLTRGDDYLTLKAQVNTLQRVATNDAKIREYQGMLGLEDAIKRCFPEIDTIEEVHNYVTLQLTGQDDLTPDLYAYGRLKSGEWYELVVDVKKMIVTLQVKDQTEKVGKYKSTLLDPRTTVYGKRFKAPRVPTKTILTALIGSAVDADALAECKTLQIPVITPDGSNYGAAPGDWRKNICCA